MVDEGTQGTGTTPTDTGTQQQANGEGGTLITEGQTQQGQADGGETKPAEGDAGKKADDNGKPQGAPEKYEFNAPEGVSLDKGVIGDFEGIARELNLSQESAQKLIDTLGPKLAASQSDQIKSTIAEAQATWLDASKTDKEFGGDALNANLGAAKKALDAFGTPELKQLLNESGLGNHPEVIRTFVRIGKQISDDGIVKGHPPGNGPKPPEKVLYPNQA